VRKHPEGLCNETYPIVDVKMVGTNGLVISVQGEGDFLFIHFMRKVVEIPKMKKIFFVIIKSITFEFLILRTNSNTYSISQNQSTEGKLQDLLVLTKLLQFLTNKLFLFTTIRCSHSKTCNKLLTNLIIFQSTARLRENTQTLAFKAHRIFLSSCRRLCRVQRRQNIYIFPQQSRKQRFKIYRESVEARRRWLMGL
jgi:hypothetical protein